MPWRVSDMSYPGITNFRSLRYVTQIGISPGTVAIECHPASTPAGGGDLTFAVTDGTTTRTITLPGCLLDMVEGTADASSRVQIVRLLDRRWAWLSSFQHDGHYNQTDSHSKLLPKAVRSPYQLAVLCLKKMGEPYPAAGSAAVGGGGVTGVTVHDGGKGYTSPPAITFASGTLAVGTAAIGGGGVTGVTITNPGSGYTSAPAVTLTGGGGTGATATATIAGGQVTGVTITAPGTGYTTAPTVGFAGGFGTGAAATAVLTGDVVTGVTITSPGSGYTVAPVVVFGEPAGFAVDLPGGLAAPPSPFAPQPGPLDLLIDPTNDWLRSGENFTRARVNLLVTWTATPAAVALAQFTEELGRCVVLDPLTNFVSVQRLGDGASLPAGRLLSDSPAIDFEAVPESVTARGSPTRFQGRFVFVPVCQDWDRAWVRPENAIMAPVLPAGQAMEVVAKVTDYDAGEDFTAVLNGVTFTSATGSHGNANNVVTAIAADITASTDPRVAGKVTASAIGSTLFVNGVADGYEFKLRVTPRERWKVRCPVGPIPPSTTQVNKWEITFAEPTSTVWGAGDSLSITVGGTTYTSLLGLSFNEAVADVANQIITFSSVATAGVAGGGFVPLAALLSGVPLTVTAGISAGSVKVTEAQPAVSVAYGFHRSFPGTGFGVRPAPDRLSYEEAKELAAQSMFSCYQLVCVDPADRDTKSVSIPTLDPITDRTLIHLLDSRVEQTAPRPGDANVIDPVTQQPYAAERYDGYSNDRRPAVYGSVNVACIGGLQYAPAGGVGANTGHDQQIYEPFDVIDAEHGVIRFARPMYRILGEGAAAVYLPIDPVVEIGVIVDDPETRTAVRYGVTVTIPGATAPPIIRTFPDIQEEIIGEFSPDHELTGFRTNDADAENRASVYAVEVALGYQFPGSQTVVYNNVETAVTISGKVRQIQWVVTAAGWSTTAGENAEFSRHVLSYGDRRRRESEPPDARKAFENLLTQPAVRKGMRNAKEAAASVANLLRRL